MKYKEIIDNLYIPKNEEVYYPAEDSFLLIDYLNTNEFLKILTNKISNKNINQENILVLNILDMGSGTGILGFSCLIKLLIFLNSDKMSILWNNYKILNISIDFIDINPKAIILTKELIEKNNKIVQYLKNKLDININIQFNYSISDLLKTFITNKIYDILIFNPPYLPFEPDLINEENQKLIDNSWSSGDPSGNLVIIKFLESIHPYIDQNSDIFFITSSNANLTSLKSEIKKLKYKCTLLKKIHIFFEDIILVSLNLVK